MSWIWVFVFVLPALVITASWLVASRSGIRARHPNVHQMLALGKEAYESGRKRSAARYFGAAHALAKDDPVVLATVGSYFFSVGNREVARECLQKAGESLDDERIGQLLSELEKGESPRGGMNGEGKDT